MVKQERRIYVADDETNIRQAIQTFLENDGYIVRGFDTGDLLFESFTQDPCDLVILDVMMPGSNGFKICKALRETSAVPIIMLTARDSDLDYATGLSIGADDYLTKPFSPMALLMRIKAIFRRMELDRQSVVEGQAPRRQLTYGDLTVDQDNRTVSCREADLDVSSNEFNLLCYLMERPDQVISREEVLKALWGMDTGVEMRTAEETAKRLRKKLAVSTVSVDALWGSGFRLSMSSPGKGASRGQDSDRDE
ncbi:MAG: response regulator transcription factor [Propionibacteriaceae bacterium]|nr:response regulator transcription factor [Propionibacteriaceae bacterium]